jgi:hypothetical protein
MMIINNIDLRGYPKMNRAAIICVFMLLFIGACTEQTPAADQQVFTPATSQLPAVSPTVIPAVEPTKYVAFSAYG